MFHFRSIKDLISTLPKLPEQLGRIFPIELLKPQRARADTVLLARHGYLGMLAIARQKADRYALRIRPEQALEQACVVVCSVKDYTVSMIAPSIRSLVPGVIAYTPPFNTMVKEDIYHPLRQLAEAFGDTTSIRGFVDRLVLGLDEVNRAKDRAALYGACDHNVWFHSLAQIWNGKREETATLAEQLMQAHPDNLIPWRIATNYHIYARDGYDVRKAVWRLVLEDDVADAAYADFGVGQWVSWVNRPLIIAVRWLENQDMQAYTQRYLGLWQAAQAFAHDPVGYDGRLHLAFAQQVAAEDPKLAYTHAANAAFYFTHATGQMPAESIIFAHELAQQQQWEHLYHVLQWVREDAHI